MERMREVGAGADSTEGQGPPTGTSTDDMAGRTGTGTRQVLVIAGAAPGSTGAGRVSRRAWPSACPSLARPAAAGARRFRSYVGTAGITKSLDRVMKQAAGLQSYVRPVVQETLPAGRDGISCIWRDLIGR